VTTEAPTLAERGSSTGRDHAPRTHDLSPASATPIRAANAADSRCRREFANPTRNRIVDEQLIERGKRIYKLRLYFRDFSGNADP
jgi:hypothetical protein